MLQQPYMICIQLQSRLHQHKNMLENQLTTTEPSTAATTGTMSLGSPKANSASTAAKLGRQQQMSQQVLAVGHGKLLTSEARLAVHHAGLWCGCVVGGGRQALHYLS